MTIATYDTQLSAEQREALAADLESAEWFFPAEDIRNEITPETVLSRLEWISGQDGEDTGDAPEIVEAHIASARRSESSASRP